MSRPGDRPSCPAHGADKPATPELTGDVRAIVAIVALLLLLPPVAAGQALSEIRVHGNHTTPDADVISLAGLTPGQPVNAGLVEDVRRRLRQSGRFEEVDVRVRYRSLSETGDVSLILVVREHPVPDARPGVPVLTPIARTLRNGMFLPILDYTDGHGVTYGLRTTFPNTLGPESRVSVPVSWGGTKRAAVEAGRTVGAGRALRIEGGAGIARRENPFYRQEDTRREAWAEVSSRVAPALRASGHAGLAGIRFGPIDDRLIRYGADVALDTRANPVFPRNALYASAGWERLDPRDSPPVNRYRLEARGYVGLGGQTVLSLRAISVRSDGPLPQYERLLLGGSASLPESTSLRGYRAGSFAGDALVAGSIELRVPFSSPLSVGKTGLTLFADTGAAHDHGTRIGNVRFRHGAGGGLFLLVSVFQLSAEVGVRAGGGTRVHVASGFRF